MGSSPGVDDKPVRQSERVSMATFFEHFTPQEIARISATGRRVKLPEGWSPIWEDTPADKAYILLSGTVSVRRDGVEIAQLGPGDIVGEAAIVGQKLRTATIVALTPLDTIHLTDDILRELDAVAADRHGAGEQDVGLVGRGVLPDRRPALGELHPPSGRADPRDLLGAEVLEERCHADPFAVPEPGLSSPPVRLPMSEPTLVVPRRERERLGDNRYNVSG